MNGDGTPTTSVDERVAQLQHALSSRIVVEQAKGVLAERYSLTPAEAYELIRLAARSNGIKVHTLSNRVLAEPRETPPLIRALFTNLPGHSIAPARAVENVFRQINESFLKLDGSHFVCECSDPRCSETIVVSPEIMRSLITDSDLYVVRPEHINTDLQELVAAYESFVIVRKPGPRTQNKRPA
jgi:hypothetical protein